MGLTIILHAPYKLRTFETLKNNEKQHQKGSWMYVKHLMLSPQEHKFGQHSKDQLL